MTLRLLAISGSLRAASGNTILLRAAALLAPSGMEIQIYPGLQDLPHFNPDLDSENSVPPKSVENLRSQVRKAQALLFSTPEYAHGVPGSLKNALDWLVSTPEMVGKPVAIFNPSPTSQFAQASLAETLKVMSAYLVPGGSITMGLQGRKLDVKGICQDPELAEKISNALTILGKAIKTRSLMT